MIMPNTGTTEYQGQASQVKWQGIRLSDGEQFDDFLSKDVATRLLDVEGTEEFETHLRALATTGFARESLETILASRTDEERDWAVGEAVAEAYLAKEYNVSWPWNTERDKRNPYASLPGADLVGFWNDGDEVRLAIGEVKSSTDMRTPPSVMNGRSGMAHQIDKLASDLSILFQLLKWLLPRCKSTIHEPAFNSAVGLLLESGNKEVVLLGVLIRDTQPDERDLLSRGNYLSNAIHNPTVCNLIAIYLPCGIAELPVRVIGGET